MADPDIQEHIKSLIEEEHRLRESLTTGDITPTEEHERLRGLEVELDQCWDLLRQRRARREYDEDPGDAEARPEGTVEHYLQ